MNKIMLFLICCITSIQLSSQNIDSSHYEIEHNEGVIVLKKWKGNETHIDMASDDVLRNVKIIGERAFEFNDKLKEIKLPTGVTEIGVGAFNRCI